MMRVITVFLSIISLYNTLYADEKLPQITFSKLTRQEIFKKIKDNKDNYLIEEPSLDLGKTQDPCIDSTSCLLSKRNNHPTPEQLALPVVILAHGFSASTYEWKDMVDYVEATESGRVLTSQVLLGGHGRNLHDFKKATWSNWQKPILDEYLDLVDQGYKHISLAGASTACTLILEALSAQSNKFIYKKQAPDHVIFIDPIVERLANHRLIRAMSFLGEWADALTYYPPSQPFTPEELQHWYAFRPFASLDQLGMLTAIVEARLKKGFVLPEKTTLSIYASQKDPTVNPLGYKLILKGIKASSGEIKAEEIKSKLHVFTRLSGRPQAVTEDDKNSDKLPIAVTRKDQETQKQVFDEIIALLMTTKS